MGGPSTKDLIATAVRRFQEEVPALRSVRLVMALELRGRGDVQLYRVGVPGPVIEKHSAADAPVRLSIPRSHFNQLATDGSVRHWREAYEAGHIRVSGPAQIIRLLGSVVERQQGRARLPESPR